MKKKPLIPNAKTMKAYRKNEFKIFLCIAAFIAIILVFSYDNIVAWFDTSDDSSLKINATLWKVSDECVHQFYPDEADNEGLILITDQTPIPDGCSRELIGAVTILMPDMSKSGIDSTAVETFKVLKESGGNLFHVESVIAVIKEDGEEVEYTLPPSS
jgi:hypothetical protein